MAFGVEKPNSNIFLIKCENATFKIKIFVALENN